MSEIIIFKWPHDRIGKNILEVSLAATMEARWKLEDDQIVQQQ